MKKILLVIWLLAPAIVFGSIKPDSIIRLDEIGPLGNGLNDGWKFHPGDNMQWAAPALDDSKWQSIEPSAPIKFLPQLREAQIGWFRLKLLVGKNLRGKTLAITMEQIGASEFYLDGKLIIQYGKVSSNYKEEETFDPYAAPFTIQLNDQAEHVLAIRYSYCRQNLYLNNGNSAFIMAIATFDTAQMWYAIHTGYYIHRTFALGIFIILGILHLSIYIGYRKRKINLYLACMSFIQAVCFLNAFFGNVHNTTTVSYIQAVFYMAAPFAFIFYLTMVYELFGGPKKLVYKLLLVLCIVIIPFEFFGQLGPSEVLLGIVGIIVYLEITRISIIAYRQKAQGATLFLCGHTIAFICFCAFNYIDVFNTGTPFDVVVIIVDLAFLTPALVLSILLAREFAQNNISLQLQLGEVQRLSEKTLAQELEKQNMLADQNEMLEQQVTVRTHELNASLENLRSTQTQLIQSEKMASLGELTAGIAHEIQNPLNFVNNFSDVNKEMLEELKAESEKPKAERDEQLEIELIKDLIENEEKINHHGKRADSIVKGMLQHSRASSNAKEPTDINRLADEYLRLAYHGLRAKDKSFNAEMVTRFDEKLSKANVVPQDIGRVLINLFNNAFYATQQKQKTAGPDYKPTLEVITSSKDGFVVVTVKDNGTGIPNSIKEKIMQPFFTTKPTGEGTGLGLSLTYDMVVKGHGGTIQVNSVEGEGSEFIIQLPIN